MTGLLLVAAGGAAGSVLRHLVSLALAPAGSGFPWATLLVNVLGSAAIGAAAAAGLEGQARLLVVTGFLGGFTTFSAFSLEAVMLFGRNPALAVLYSGLSLGLGFGAFAVAVWVFRR